MTQDEIPKLDLYHRVVRAKLFIDRNYAQNIDAGDIADEAYDSKYHFIRTFKSIYGETPHQYLIGVRVERARELLGSGRAVTDVSLSVGFESLGYFTELFKRRTGLSPSAYLRKRIARKRRIAEAPLRFVPGCFAAMFCHNAASAQNSNFEEARPRPSRRYSHPQNYLMKETNDCRNESHQYLCARPGERL